MKFILLSSILLISLLVHTQNPTCGFGFSKTITIDGNQVTGGPHLDFPVLISHIDADLNTASAKVTSASGFDIIFADDNGVLLDFQLESYNGATGEIVAWVKLPSVTNGTDVDIHILYGKPSIITNQSTTAVWDANFTGVWHMNQDPSGAAPQITEASGGGSNGTSNGAMTVADLVPGKTGNGIDFDGTNDFIELGDVLIDGTTNLTIEAWINPTTLPVNATPSGHNSNEGAIVHKNGATDDNLGLTVATGATAFYIDENSDNTLRGAVVPATTWTHITATWDNSIMTIYQNGVLDVTLGSVNGTFVNNNNSLRFGGAHGAGGGNPHYFNGIIDEIRISNIARSAAWCTTSFNSQNQPTTTVGVVTAGDFYTVGAEIDQQVTSQANGDWDDAGTWAGGTVPNSQFTDVLIQHNVDIDAASADYTICNCALNSTGAIAVRLDISSTRILDIKENLTTTLSGAGASTTAVNLTNTAQLIVGGDVDISNTNSTTTANLDIQLREDCQMSVAGDVNSTITDGDDSYIDLEDNSVLTIAGDVNFSQSGGDEIGFNIDDNASCTINGDVTIIQSGGDDTRIIANDDSDITIDGITTITKTGGDDIILRCAGATASYTSTGDITANCSGTSDTTRLVFDINDGTFTMNNVTVTRSTDMGAILFDADGGIMSVQNVVMNSSGSSGGAQINGIDCDGTSNVTMASLTFNMSGGEDSRVRVNSNSGTDAFFNCTNDIVVNHSGGDDVQFLTRQNGIMTVGGNITVNHTGGDRVTTDLNGSSTINITGNYIVNHSQGGIDELDLQISSTVTCNVGGNLIMNNTNGGGDCLIDINGGTLNVTGNLELNNAGAGTTEDIDLFIDGDGITNITGNLNVNLTGGNDIDVRLGREVGSTGSLNVTGDINLVQNSPSGNHVIRYNVEESTLSSCNNYNVTYSAGSLLLISLIENGTLIANGNIDFNSVSSGRIEMRGDDNSEIRIAGNFDRTPSAFGELDMATTATLEFFGSAVQIFPEDAGGGGDFFDYGIVEINNSSAANPQITMEGNATVHGGMIWIDGVVASTPTELLIFDDNASTSGASNASHCDGQVQKIGDDSFTFPTGDNDYYGGIEINSLSNQLATDVFTAQYFEAQHPESYFSKLGYETAGGITDGMEQTSRVEYWELTRDNGSCEPVVRLYWTDNGRSDISDLSSLVVAHNTAVKTWKNEGGNTGGLLANGFVESTTKVTTFSPFTFGSLDESNNDLPIELISFTAVLNDGVVDLNWTTASEINNEYFEVQNSKDGIEWHVVAKQDGAGNSIQLLHYEDKDYAPLSGVSYYRLKQVDYDGQFAHSKVVKVTNENGTINIFPNPNNGLFQVTLESIENSFQIICYDIAGKRIELDYSVDNRTININTPLSAGIYVLSVLSDNNIYSERITVK